MRSPFLGLDCSIKDCKDNCNYNGYCSVEYPVSRCVCNPTYFGESCEFIECINNCSYPNGLCNYTEVRPLQNKSFALSVLKFSCGR